jgi:hypothetical protein
MSYQVDLKLEAHQDIFEAMLWYESKGEGLGAEFYAGVEKVKKTLSVTLISLKSNTERMSVGFKQNVFPIL